MRAVAALCLLAACGFDHGNASPSGDGGGSGDATIDSPPGCTTYSTQFDTCSIGVGLGTTNLDLSGLNTYDTDTGTLLNSLGTVVAVPHQIVTTLGGPIDVIFVASFTLHAGATLRVQGPNNDRPLGIASVGAVQIDGTLDLAVNGAGARDDANCTSDGAKGANNTAGAAGGGGAGFGGAGGNGANGNGNGTQSLGGTGGAATFPRPTHIIGGCDGGDGGDAAGTTVGGLGGDGGGAVFIATPTTIAIGITGAISAGGGGGKTGTGAAAGAGGGGSGGFILLEAMMITNAGVLAANGGGGGEGGGTGAGNDGDDAHISALPAAGGSGNESQGGDGQAGGAGATASGTTATDVQNGGGGGGGGGVGFIATTVLPISSGGSIISPPRQAWP